MYDLKTKKHNIYFWFDCTCIVLAVHVPLDFAKRYVNEILLCICQHIYLLYDNC